MTAGLAAGWYIALPSASLRSAPRALDLFGRELVAWRDRVDRPVIMSRHCPHLAADLSLGKVVDGRLRCRFHHWQFDRSGACVEIPGVTRIPRLARLEPYPVIERYGLIWVWYGGTKPMFPLPEMPAVEADRTMYLRYSFAHTTPAPARRVLENAFDYYHFMSLHGIQAAAPVSLTMLSDPLDAAENGPPIAPQAWTGALLKSRGLQVPAPIRAALGIKGERFALLVDGWPGGQRLTFFLDDQVVARELLGITPVGPGRTIFRGWALVRRSGNPLRDALTYLLYRSQHYLGTRQDLGIFADVADGHVAPVAYDHSVLRFRKHYQTWVRRAETAERSAAI